jgi:cell shape-determining protein MreC
MVDHLAMNQAMVNALQHRISQLEDDLNYNSLVCEDNQLLADALAESLTLLLSNNYTDDDIQRATSILDIWKNNRTQP